MRRHDLIMWQATAPVVTLFHTGSGSLWNGLAVKDIIEPRNGLGFFKGQVLVQVGHLSQLRNRVSALLT